MSINTTGELYEAPASVTLSVVTPKGYNALFTLRERTGKELLEKIGLLEVKLEELGYKPQVKQAFQKKEQKYVEGVKCPKCGGRLIEKLTKAGKPYHKCENGKWNPQTGPSGCDFVDWLQPKVEFNHKEPYSNGDNIPIEEYDN